MKVDTSTTKEDDFSSKTKLGFPIILSRTTLFLYFNVLYLYYLREMTVFIKIFISIKRDKLE